MNGWSRTAAIGFIGVVVGGAGAWLSLGQPTPPAWLWWSALVALIILVFGGLLLALLGPGVRWMARVPQPTRLDGEFTAKDQLDAINAVRSTILQSITGSLSCSG